MKRYRLKFHTLSGACSTAVSLDKCENARSGELVIEWGADAPVDLKHYYLLVLIKHTRLLRSRGQHTSADKRGLDQRLADEYVCVYVCVLD